MRSANTDRALLGAPANRAIPTTSASSHTRTLALSALLLCVSVGACTNANGGAKPPAPPPSPKDDSEVAERAPERAPVAASALTEFPKVSLEGLGGTERLIFAQIVNEEVCPCDCPMSWGACLQEGTACQPAVLLADWLIGELAEGVDPDILATQVAQEIGAFASKPKEISTTGFASKGAASAKLTIVEFADFECAHCKAVNPVLDSLLTRHGQRLRVVYKHFPLSFHPMAKLAAEATEAAAMQGRFWEMHAAVFATQNMLDDDLLQGHARALGLDLKRWDADRKSDAVIAKVAASRQEGESIGVEATPSFYMNGRPFQLMRTLPAFEARMAMEDARASSSCR